MHYFLEHLLVFLQTILQDALFTAIELIEILENQNSLSEECKVWIH
jgi:hypothetical protein